MQSPLVNLTILVTRPQRQNKELMDHIIARGGRAIALPTLEIVPTVATQALKHSADHLADYTIAIFVSANAAHYAIPYFQQPFLIPIIIAIGSGTAATLSALGIQAGFIPEQHCSEGILQLPILQQVVGKKIIVFCGEDSRPLLRDILSERGAIVTEWVSYERRCPPCLSPEAFTQLQAQKIDIIVSTSQASLNCLMNMLGESGKQWLQQRTILVISEAMAVYAKNLGFPSILVAKGASSEAIVNAIHCSSS